ncbi:MAG: response regulator [Phycisphaerales bacterium]
MRILMIDDSNVMRSHQRSVLEKMGDHQIEEACNGMDALQKLKAFEPELILLDWNMPVMDGISFLKAFRAMGRKTPVIMVTTEAEKPRVMEAIKAGVSAYCIKPFSLETIRAVIEKTMGAFRKAG